jgi:hypothetical protein
MLNAGLVEEERQVERGDEVVRRRYWAITALGRAVAEAEASRLAVLVRTAERLRLTGG